MRLIGVGLVLLFQASGVAQPRIAEGLAMHSELLSQEIKYSSFFHRIIILPSRIIPWCISYTVWAIPNLPGWSTAE
jgi:hypothetical protein